MNRSKVGHRLDRLTILVSVTLIVAKAIYVVVIISKLVALA